MSFFLNSNPGTPNTFLILKLLLTDDGPTYFDTVHINYKNRWSRLFFLIKKLFMVGEGSAITLVVFQNYFLP